MSSTVNDIQNEVLWSRSVTFAFHSLLSTVPDFQRISAKPSIMWTNADFRADNAFVSAVDNLASSIVHQRAYIADNGENLTPTETAEAVGIVRAQLYRRITGTDATDEDIIAAINEALRDDAL